MRRFIFSIILLSAVTTALARDPASLVLDRRMPEVRFENIALTDAIDFLRDVSEANIHVNWRALEPLLIGPDTIVNLRLLDVPLRKILSVLLADIGMAGQVSFYIDRGVIEITTREIADSQMLTRVYDIQDLLLEIPDFEGPDLNLSSNQGKGGGGGTGIFDPQDNSDTSNEDRKTKTERADDIVQLIQETIQPEIWRDNGGNASIRYYQGNVIVTAPRSVHEAIGGPID